MNCWAKEEKSTDMTLDGVYLGSGGKHFQQENTANKPYMWNNFVLSQASSCLVSMLQADFFSKFPGGGKKKHVAG